MTLVIGLLSVICLVLLVLYSIWVAKVVDLRWLLRGSCIQYDNLMKDFQQAERNLRVLKDGIESTENKEATLWFLVKNCPRCSRKLHL